MLDRTRSTSPVETEAGARSYVARRAEEFGLTPELVVHHRTEVAHRGYVLKRSLCINGHQCLLHPISDGSKLGMLLNSRDVYAHIMIRAEEGIDVCYVIPSIAIDAMYTTNWVAVRFYATSMRWRTYREAWHVLT